MCGTGKNDPERGELFQNLRKLIYHGSGLRESYRPLYNQLEGPPAQINEDQTKNRLFPIS